ncbi:Histone transcription regulator 3 like protein [Trifolium repens]|nr:Histone transcription regulator 3 like protein [Trifolium repens]
MPWFLAKRIVGHLSRRLQQLDIKCETKTKNFDSYMFIFKSINGFICMYSTVHFSHFVPNELMLIRCSKIKLDDAFEQKNGIAKVVEEELEKLCQIMDMKLFKH